MTAIESAGPELDSALPSPIDLPAPQRRNDSLDGLRAIAVLLVMGVHIAFPFLSLGWLGVDVFFVLSGFLITTLLCNEYARHGRISLPKFWGRRFLRLMPVYWLYVGSLTAYMLLGPTSQLHAHGNWSPGEYILALWTYFVNLAPAGGIWTHQHLTLHLWSLAVEEQFYFIWPPLCVVILRFRRPWIVGLLLIALILCFRHGAQPWALKATLWTRGLGIVMGSTLALYMRDRPPRLLRLFAAVQLRWIVGGLTVVAYLALELLERSGRLTEEQIHQYALPWLCLLFTCVAGMLWYGPFDRTARSLSWPPLAYLGRISYGVYVYHLVAQLLVWDIFLRNIEHWHQIPKYGLRCLLYFGITLAISVTSYRLIERPFLRIKDRLR
jgi:peptidoglycan/LPS O-acetylase OafA/YrhL